MLVEYIQQYCYPVSKNMGDLLLSTYGTAMHFFFGGAYLLRSTIKTHTSQFILDQTGGQKHVCGLLGLHWLNALYESELLSECQRNWIQYKHPQEHEYEQECRLRETY